MRYGFRKMEQQEVLSGHLHLGGENPAGERIDVTSAYFTRGGKPWIPVMGEIHFQRCARSRWKEMLCKMKAGGITLVSTYLFWIYNEEQEGRLDFTGDNDIRAFVEECAAQGLDVVLRVGPWAHGECRNGGLPDWLLAKDYPLRENNEEYLAQVHRWYSAIAEQVRGLFYKDGGNIVAVQLENEYVHNAEHLARLKEIAVECGLEAPLYTVTGWNSAAGARIPVDEVVPVFGGYCEAPWEGHTRQLAPSPHYFFNRMRNDSAIGADLLAHKGEEGDWQLPYERYPFATCELGGGIQVTHHRRPIIQGMDIYAVSLVKLGDGNNLPGYYMYCGGTNKVGKLSTLQESKATNYPNDYSILSYDFQAAVSEYGEIREQYRYLNLLHLFVQDFQEILAPMAAVDAQDEVKREDTESLRYGMRSDGKSGFVFVNHYQRLTELADVKGAVIDTGSVEFPAIDVCGEISFFLPFGLKMGEQMLEYATAQPICRQGNTYFFAELPGINPEYRFADGTVIRPGARLAECTGRKAAEGSEGEAAKAAEGFGSKAAKAAEDFEGEASKVAEGFDGKSDGKAAGSWLEVWENQMGDIRILTITLEQAKYLRRLDKEIYIGESCDLYREDGRILAVQGGCHRYARWNGEKFEEGELGRQEKEPKLTVSEVVNLPFAIPELYLAELQLEQERKLTFRRVEVEGTEGFVSFEESYDVAQLYADGELVADNFYYGKPWRVPAALLAGRECYLVMSEMKDDFYREF